MGLFTPSCLGPEEEAPTITTAAPCILMVLFAEGSLCGLKAAALQSKCLPFWAFSSVFLESVLLLVISLT